jgi:hypothetical protein
VIALFRSVLGVARAPAPHRVDLALGRSVLVRAYTRPIILRR